MTKAAGLADGQTDDEGSKGKTRSVTRVQMDLPPRSMERLTALKEKTEAGSYAEVIKNALRLYETLVAEVEQGNEFLVRDQDANLVPYRMFI